MPKTSPGRFFEFNGEARPEVDTDLCFGPFAGRGHHRDAEGARCSLSLLGKDFSPPDPPLKTLIFVVAHQNWGQVKTRSIGRLCWRRELYRFSWSTSPW